MLRLSLFLTLALLSLGLPGTAWAYADDSIPNDALTFNIINNVHMPLAQVGSGSYHKWGLDIYEVTLWAPNGVYDTTKPYALQLHYDRSVSKERILDGVIDAMREQNATDEETLKKWDYLLHAYLYEVEDGDEFTGLYVPWLDSTMLFMNGYKITTMPNGPMTQAFFNIWLGDKADPDLRAKLLGKSQ